MKLELKTFIAATILKISLSRRYHMKAYDQMNKMVHLDFFISTHRAVEMRSKGGSLFFSCFTKFIVSSDKNSIFDLFFCILDKIILKMFLKSECSTGYGQERTTYNVGYGGPLYLFFLGRWEVCRDKEGFLLFFCLTVI